MKQLTKVQMWRYAHIAKMYKKLHKVRKGVGLRRSVAGETTYEAIARMGNGYGPKHLDLQFTSAEVNRAVSNIRQRQRLYAPPTGYAVFDKIGELPRFAKAGTRVYKTTRTYAVSIQKAKDSIRYVSPDSDKMVAPITRSDGELVEDAITTGERWVLSVLAGVIAVSLLSFAFFGEEILNLFN